MFTDPDDSNENAKRRTSVVEAARRLMTVP
ncbi:hypothetical protein [Yersinia aldovae]